LPCLENLKNIGKICFSNLPRDFLLNPDYKNVCCKLKVKFEKVQYLNIITKEGVKRLMEYDFIGPVNTCRRQAGWL